MFSNYGGTWGHTLARRLTKNGRAYTGKSGANIFKRVFRKAGFGCYCKEIEIQ